MLEPMTLRRPSRSAGISALELLIVVAIVAILAVIGIPSFAPVTDRYRLKSAADSAASILHFARSEAIVANTPVFVSFATGANSCAGARRNGPCDCHQTSTTAADYCTLKLLDTSELRGVTAASAAFGANSYTVFDPVRGTADSGSVTLASPAGKQLAVNLSALGRVKLCAPAGPPPLPGYSPC